MARKNAKIGESSGVLLFDQRTKAVMATSSATQEGIKEKVQAVREIVPGHSNNQIVLVLQYYDYNVEEAIQALCDDGAKQALQGWHMSSGHSKQPANKKKKKNKNKSKDAQEVAPPEESSWSTDAINHSGQTPSTNQQTPLQFSNNSMPADHNASSAAAAATATDHNASSAAAAATATDVPFKSNHLTNGSLPYISDDDAARRPLVNGHEPIHNNLSAAALPSSGFTPSEDAVPSSDFAPSAALPVPHHADITPGVTANVSADPQPAACGNSADSASSLPVFNSSSSVSPPTLPSAPSSDAAPSSHSQTLLDKVAVTTTSKASASSQSVKSTGSGKTSNKRSSSKGRPAAGKVNAAVSMTAVKEVVTNSVTSSSRPLSTNTVSSKHSANTSSVSHSAAIQSAPPPSTARPSTLDVFHASNRQRQRTSSEVSTSSDTWTKPHAGIEKSVKDLHRQTLALQRYKPLLNDEVQRSYKQISQVFEELHKQLNEREAELMFAMDQVKNQTLDVLTKRQNQATELKVRTDRSLRAEELADLRADIKHFVSERKIDEDLGTTKRFTCDLDSMVGNLKTFGQVTSVKAAYSPRRSSTSSLSSSVDLQSPFSPSPFSPSASQSSASLNPHKASSSYLSGAKVLSQSDSLTRYEVGELQNRLTNVKLQDKDNFATSSTSSGKTQGPRRGQGHSQTQGHNQAQDHSQAQADDAKKSRSARRRQKQREREREQRDQGEGQHEGQDQAQKKPQGDVNESPVKGNKPGLPRQQQHQRQDQGERGNGKADQGQGQGQGQAHQMIAQGQRRQRSSYRTPSPRKTASEGQGDSLVEGPAMKANAHQARSPSHGDGRASQVQSDQGNANTEVKTPLQPMKAGTPPRTNNPRPLKANSPRQSSSSRRRDQQRSRSRGKEQSSKAVIVSVKDSIAEKQEAGAGASGGARGADGSTASASTHLANGEGHAASVETVSSSGIKSATVMIDKLASADNSNAATGLPQRKPVRSRRRPKDGAPPGDSSHEQVNGMLMNGDLNGDITGNDD